jgi:hypothetical protein
MRFLKFFVFLALLGLWPGLALAGDFSFSGQVSKDHVELGEPFTLTLVISMNGNFAFQPQITAPNLDGFQIQGGPAHNSQQSWVNGAVSSTDSYTWELVALKSGTLQLGPFTASAKDAAQGDLSKTVAAIKIYVSKGASGPVLPPTPTPDTGSAASSEDDSNQLRGIKADLGPPWARIAALALAVLLILGIIAWLVFRPKKPKKLEVIRDPGQVALMDLEKAKALLAKGDEEAYYKELGRIIRFYLRHRLRSPEKEMTLFEAERLALKALPEGSETRIDLEALPQLQALLFGGIKPQAKDADQVPAGLRQLILELEKGALWRPSESVKAELERIREVYGAQGGEPYFKALAKAFGEHRERLDEELGPEALEDKMAKALEELGPAAAARVSDILLSKKPKEDMDLDKLCKDLQRLADALEGGHAHGKRN